MAEIDKGLPNVRREINIPSVEEQTEVIGDLQETAPSHEKTEVVENQVRMKLDIENLLKDVNDIKTELPKCLITFACLYNTAKDIMHERPFTT